LHGNEEYVQRLTALVVKAVRDGVSLSAEGVGKAQLSEFELDQGPFQKEQDNKAVVTSVHWLDR
jgi:hypothetical protein